ncbi:LysR family transcriptional regulator [Paraburkholderia phenoliruptrix]|uniref:LysR family transcriptional regulator n=1 Tax=Paraburkholderia phenoliruptrix TaxID=252970 RepID=UPI001C4F9B10|nr:LysR family transcriptional regulator [Paraburkholderia phenoliruptrix]MBW0448480.1 LysR family transcriptional regulator [Paraburkholderia phenoliruptrix]MBW9100658.1 LysR family transcriptional regulator [Paraburkholderia phenoliruptrix]MBW9102677.1 LysR family transcriptional regulator [Paraburkholderia phenoliruptrix]MBW9128960.1 LysR family transcriptional regulator [Paraburkholderia ginsengiterrae]
MEWSDVRIFLAIARTGTLGAAARTLQLSHPTIGRRLRALEASMGQVLFQRTADGFVLTEEGSAIVPLAEHMEESALAMERRLTGEQQKLEGTLKVSSADWFGAYVLPPVIAEYAREYPFVQMEILTGTRLFSLAQREADVAFRIVPFDGPDIVQRRLTQMRYGVYVAASHPDPAEGDGSGHRLIAMDTSTGAFPDIDWLKNRFPNAGVVLQSNNRNVQAQMCGRGLGIAVLPRPVGDQLPTVRRLDLRDEPPHRDIWMGYHRDLRRLGRLRAFVDLAIKHVAN